MDLSTVHKLESFNQLFVNCKKLAIAVSGGADSMALIVLCQLWAEQNDCQIVALTVDHGLRAESGAEAELVQRWMQTMGIEHHILQWKKSEQPTSNIQAQAREARYDLLTNWCLQNNVEYLGIAHHLDDQAETFLLNLFRGSSIDGLSCMPVISVYNDIKIVRPLLDVTKAELVNLLIEQNLTWVEDPSNHNEQYTRTLIRQFIAEQNILDPILLSKRLADTAKHMARVRQSIELSTNHYMQQVVILEDSGAKLQGKLFATLPQEEALRILENIIRAIGGVDKLRFHSLLRVYNLVVTKQLRKITCGKCIISMHKDYVIEFWREKGRETTSN
jgi:tRNA(Ile)-lysidine synthase